MLKYLLIFIFALSGCATAPEKKAAPPPAKAQKHYFVKVKKGDTLYSIAWKAGLDYKTLARWNHLKPPYTIYPGQVLRLFPDPNARPKAKKPVKTAKKSKVSRQHSKKAQKKQPSSRDSSWQWPVKGKLISRFKPKDPTHKGIEIAGQLGQSIRAARSGEVVYVGEGLINYGQLIIIKHNETYLSAYGYNQFIRVKEGQKVKKGQIIADMGQRHDGRSALYFEIRRYGKPVNPLNYLPK